MLHLLDHILKNGPEESVNDILKLKVQMQAGHAVEIGSSAGGVALSSATAMDLRSGGSATLTAGGAVAVLSEVSSCLDFKAVEVGSCTDSNG